jgi:hypothetical protein
VCFRREAAVLAVAIILQFEINRTTHWVELQGKIQ